MKKLFSFFAALTLCVGLWAEDVIITYTATTSLQELFNNPEKFQPAPVSNDYAEGIGTVTFPNLMEIRNEAFKDCSALTSITLPASIINIGVGAFTNCENLQSITCKASLPPGCDPEAFENVTLPMPLYVPASSIEAYQNGFWGEYFEVQVLPIVVGDQFKDETTGLCFEITSLGTPKTVKVIRGKPYYSNSSYNIPSSVTYSNVEYTVTAIEEDAFYNCWEVTSVTLPSTITTIEEYAFDACSALTSVTFLGNACQESIGSGAFRNVGATDPALLTLPDNWTGTLPDKDGKWYGGKFELSSIPGLTTYLDENGEEQEIVAAEVENASEADTWGTAGGTTWYIVKGTDVQLSKGAICAGDVRLILADGAKLTATGDFRKAGIQVSGDGNSLTIYAQSTGEQSGQLIANGGQASAGIGGGNQANGSSITINGGTVTATGNGAAGIGGGSEGSGSNITINGGTVTAKGGSQAAGIGGGYEGSGSDITINGGTVIATGDGAAGIGGGQDGSGSNITINGGTVTATSKSQGAGIGGGMNGSGSNITINGGTVTAKGGSASVAGIGKGNHGTASNIYISDAYILKAGKSATLTDDKIVAHSSATDLASTLTQQYVQFGGLATPYTRTVTANSWGTVCLPYAVTGFSGVTFYKVNYYNAGENALYLEEVTALEAGKPYIFEAEEDGTLTINHSATAPMAYSEAGNEGGLYGSFARTDIESDGDMAALSGGNIVVVNNEGTVTVPACRAYLDMSEVATSQQGNAPLRKFGAPRGTATGEMRIENGEMRMNGKFIINGRLIIVKDGKKINALGL